MSTHQQLEEQAISICRGQEASGVLMLIIYPQKRAEVVAAFTEAVDDLPGKLQRLADAVRDGDGMPLGRNLQTIHPSTDLFGEAAPAPMTERQRKDQPKGYARPPGTGPAGETCGTCIHCQGTWSGTGKRFNKCDVIRFRWTGGPGTDIRRKSPACAMWEAKTK
jgi:hypothetical protein